LVLGIADGLLHRRRQRQRAFITAALPDLEHAKTGAR
jgi:hypothetical protein